MNTRTFLPFTIALFLGGCSSGSAGMHDQARPRESAASRVVGAGSAGGGDQAHAPPADAARRFQAFLEASRIGNPAPVPDSLIACDPEWAAEQNVALAAYKVVGITGRGDSLTATAQVTTVAEEQKQTNEADGYVLRQRVGSRVLHWTLVRNPATGKYGVCNYSVEGVDFLRASPSAHVTRWIPAGASWTTVRALADSVAGHR
jgi:hypothetical protein